MSGSETYARGGIRVWNWEQSERRVTWRAKRSIRIWLNYPHGVIASYVIGRLLTVNFLTLWCNGDLWRVSGINDCGSRWQSNFVSKAGKRDTCKRFQPSEKKLTRKLLAQEENFWQVPVNEKEDIIWHFVNLTTLEKNNILIWCPPNMKWKWNHLPVFIIFGGLVMTSEK